MKFHAITSLTSSLLAIVITVSVNNVAVAQDDAVTVPEQPEPTPTTPNDTDAANLNEQETTVSDTDCVDIPDGAPANAQGTAAAEAQGTNAQRSRAGENQSDAGATNSNAEIAQNRDDCLDIRSGVRQTED